MVAMVWTLKKKPSASEPGRAFATPAHGRVHRAEREVHQQEHRHERAQRRPPVCPQEHVVQVATEVEPAPHDDDVVGDGAPEPPPTS
jgi:hypothetical protein